MQKYQSHKVVEAAKIINFNLNPSTGTYSVELADGMHELSTIAGERIKAMCAEKGVDPSDGYLVIYDAGATNEWISWSPADVFEAGYSLVQPSSGKSNIKG